MMDLGSVKMVLFDGRVFVVILFAICLPTFDLHTLLSAVDFVMIYQYIGINISPFGPMYPSSY